MLPNTSLTPYVCCRPHTTRTTTSDARHRRHTSGVRRSYSYDDDARRTTGHARVRTSIQYNTHCTTGEATSMTYDSLM